MAEEAGNHMASIASKYLHYGFDAGPEDAIEVRMGRAANVLLLDPPNHERYRAREHYEYDVGYVTVSPYHLPVPRRGRWHIVIDRGGRDGTVRAAVELLPGIIGHGVANG